MELMRGLDLLVLDALALVTAPNPTHFTIPESLKIVEHLRPARTYFVHMSHDVEHHDTKFKTP